MNILLNKPVAPDIKRLTKYLESVNHSGWYTNFGPLHDELTLRLQNYLKVDNLLLVSNGTLALQVASRVLNVQAAVTTPFSFAATSSSLLWQGIKLSYSDINRHTYNLCPIELAKNLEIDNSYDSIVATHVYGNPCNVELISNVAEKYGKKIVYDAAHAFGVNINGSSVLNEGDASTLSFHATKVFHTVEGGAIVFKCRNNYNRARELINFGIKPNGQLGEPGINAKLNEYQSAVGLTMLDCIDNILDHRAALFEKYVEELKNTVEIPKWHSGANTNGAYMPISSIMKTALLMW
ncbi:UDP-4-amino-4-deoxy-L-arabinose-oxoglutarate aminotransferase [Vibrio astriarenae]|nr:UDP-4-amino-4-deoxy-L-arabinose-oxoglutarate aminotransferase [Vibrio sp. C7]